MLRNLKKEENQEFSISCSNIRWSVVAYPFGFSCFSLVARKTGRKRRRRVRRKEKKGGRKKGNTGTGGKGDEIWRTNWPVALDGHSWIQIFIATWPECWVKAAKCGGGGRSLIKRKIRGVSCISLLPSRVHRGCISSLSNWYVFLQARFPPFAVSSSLFSKHRYSSVAKIFIIHDL